MEWNHGRIHMTPHASLWVPLTWISFMADVSVFGFNPGAMHAVNLALHATAAALLFLALRRMTGRLWESVMVAALFALHPINVESVAWVTERKNVLCAVFWMLTLLAYARYAERPGVTRYLAVFAACALALLSKPLAVTLPFALLLLDFWPLQRHRGPAGCGSRRKRCRCSCWRSSGHGCRWVPSERVTRRCRSTSYRWRSGSAMRSPRLSSILAISRGPRGSVFSIPIRERSKWPWQRRRRCCSAASVSSRGGSACAGRICS